MTANIPEYRTVYRTLHRPLTVWGVERRLFFLSLMVGAAAFNLFYSFIGGLFIAVVLYAAAFWATTHDPDMLSILFRAARYRAQYDGAKSTSADLRVIRT